MLNKRGQEGGTWQIILIVLAVVVGIFLIIGFTRGFGIFTDIFSTADTGDLQILAKACAGYAEAGLTISYCDYKEIEVNGQTTFVNCEDSRIQQELINSGIDVGALSCSNNENIRKQVCFDSVTANQWDSVRVGRDTCDNITDCADKNDLDAEFNCNFVGPSSP